jgi:hypothetical protein
VILVFCFIEHGFVNSSAQLAFCEMILCSSTWKPNDRCGISSGVDISDGMKCNLRGKFSLEYQRVLGIIYLSEVADSNYGMLYL